jgi:hypothetical protein
MFRSTAGTLPTDATPTVGGITLPKGRVVTATEAQKPGPVAWVTEGILTVDELEPLVRKLAAAFPTTGLWPIRARGLDDDDIARPWHDGEFTGPDDRTVEAITVLSAQAVADQEPDFPDTDPDSTEPDPVTALAAPIAGPDMTADQIEVDQPGGLLLVPVARPADVPAALGWIGATNSDLAGAELTSVLRSWEDRFGAVLTGLGFDTMTVQLARIPENPETIQAILAEHYAFCADNIDQGLPADQYAEGLTEWRHWDFWWD